MCCGQDFLVPELFDLVRSNGTIKELIRRACNVHLKTPSILKDTSPDLHPPLIGINVDQVCFYRMVITNALHQTIIGHVKTEISLQSNMLKIKMLVLSQASSTTKMWPHHCFLFSTDARWMSRNVCTSPSHKT